MAWLPILAALGSGVGSYLGSKSSGKSGSMKGGKKVEPLRKDQLKLLEKITKHFPTHGLDISHKGLYKRGYEHLKNLLSNDPEAIRAFEAPALRQFNEQIIPGLTSKFSQFGAGGLQSSGFRNALAEQSRALTENLAAQRSGLQMQAIPRALEFLQGPAQNLYNRAALGLGVPGVNYVQPAPPQPGFFSNLAGGLGQGLGQLGAQGIAQGFSSWGGSVPSPSYGSTQWGSGFPM